MTPMTNTIQNQYRPNYVSPPGETLEEILEEREMTQIKLAERMGRPKKTINEIIKGKAEITPDTALQLERVLGTPARFWIERERLYREHLARQAENKRLEIHLPWLKQIPYKEMTKRGWLLYCEDKIEQLREILNFFAIASPDIWEEIWSKNISVDFRKPSGFKSDLGAMTAWLQQGEIEASKIDCADYDANKFKEVLQEIRSLTVEPIEIFQPKMIQLCAEAGVAVVLIPELSKTRVCGATRWLSSRKAILQLSDRYKTNDHFWFSFFHEAGHILLHGKCETFLEVPDPQTTDKEKEADQFAGDFLIPAKKWAQFTETNPQSKQAICQFADNLKIAPSIVVGRLQREQIIPYNHYNDLKLSLRLTM
jgi:HTH-type transcriptional regulator / antitoxin HigA